MLCFYLSLNQQAPNIHPFGLFVSSNGEYTYTFFTRDDRELAKTLLPGGYRITEEFELEVDQDESGNFNVFK